MSRLSVLALLLVASGALASRVAVMSHLDTNVFSPQPGTLASASVADEPIAEKPHSRLNLNPLAIAVAGLSLSYVIVAAVALARGLSRVHHLLTFVPISGLLIGSGLQLLNIEHPLAEAAVGVLYNGGLMLLFWNGLFVIVLNGSKALGARVQMFSLLTAFALTLAQVIPAVYLNVYYTIHELVAIPTISPDTVEGVIGAGYIGMFTFYTPATLYLVALVVYKARNGKNATLGTPGLFLVPSLLAVNSLMYFHAMVLDLHVNDVMLAATAVMAVPICFLAQTLFRDLLNCAKLQAEPAKEATLSARNIRFASRSKSSKLAL